MVKCKKCGKEIDALEVFPKGYCVDCHEKEFDKELKRTGIMPKPNFVEIIKWKQ